MVVMDEYSCFQEVEIVASSSAGSTVPKVDAIFARQEIPDVLKERQWTPPSMAWNSRTLLSI